MNKVRPVQETESYVGWVLSGILGIITTLAGIITMFYKSQVAEFHERITKSEQRTVALESKVKECETDRTEIKVQHAVLQNENNNIKHLCTMLEARVSDLEANKKNRDSIG